MQHLIRTADFSVEEIIELFEDARGFKDMKSNKILDGKIIVTLFFENSTSGVCQDSLRLRGCFKSFWQTITG